MAWYISAMPDTIKPKTIDFCGPSASAAQGWHLDCHWTTKNTAIHGQ